MTIQIICNFLQKVTHTIHSFEKKNAFSLFLVYSWFCRINITVRKSTLQLQIKYNCYCKYKSEINGARFNKIKHLTNRIRWQKHQHVTGDKTIRQLSFVLTEKEEELGEKEGCGKDVMDVVIGTNKRELQEIWENKLEAQSLLTNYGMLSNIGNKRIIETVP